MTMNGPFPVVGKGKLAVGCCFASACFNNSMSQGADTVNSVGPSPVFPS